MVNHLSAVSTRMATYLDLMASLSLHLGTLFLLESLSLVDQLLALMAHCWGLTVNLYLDPMVSH